MKRFLKSSLAISLCFIMLCSFFAMGVTASATVVDSGTCGANLTWTLDDEGTLTISGAGDMYDFDLDESPWYGNVNIKNVLIDNGVISIGDMAFAYCSSLESITIPEGVTNIGDWAFYNCSSLESITIPDSVISIGHAAFGYCKSLASITIPDSVTSIGGAAFYRCSSLESITIPNSVTSIGESAFFNCSSLESITIPNSVTSIGRNAFSDCSSLTSITIPDSVTSIGSGVFGGCSSLTSITIPDSVTSIGDNAFYYCENLTSITIPDSVTSIGDKAFYHCPSLTSITISDSVTSIGEYAFAYCSSLTSITISDSVTSIDNYAFDYCPKLVVFCNKDSYTHTYCSTKSVDYVLLDDDTDRYITGSLGTKLTWSIDKLQRTLTINCNGNMPTFSSNAAPWKEYSKYFFTATIEDGCTSIGDWAFRGCTSLTSITIPEGVTSIGDYAFRDCSSLESITIPEGVTSIGNYAFYECKSLTSITIPEGVTSIGSSAFYNCKSLTSITIPEGVTSIGWEAFCNCSSLTSITIPNSVTSIGSRAFSNCTSLTSITIPEGVTSIGGRAFSGCSSLTEIEIPYSVKTIEYSTFSNCSALDKIYIYNRNCSIDTSAIPYTATIYGFTGSAAETFADENGYYFTAIDDTHEHVYKNDCDSKCNLCGATRTVTHAYELTTSKAPTCTAKGNETYVCSICNDSYISLVAALGHTYGTYTSNGDATCTKDGTKIAVCTVCEAKNTITDKGSKLPHTDANKDGYCDVCKTVTNADLANPCRNAKINVASTKSVDYKAQVTIKATANGVPTGYSLAMYVNGKQVAKGSNTEVTYTVGQATSDINYTVKVIDAKGNVQKDSANKDLAKDGGKITVNSSFFAKIIAFFKSLFGSLPVVTIKP